MSGALERAVCASDRLTRAVQVGKKALKSPDRDRVTFSGARLTDSLALDREYESERPNSHRWDYLLGVQAGKSACVLAMEVHPATPAEVHVVIGRG